jgi:exodeoxyribonuclease III
MPRKQKSGGVTKKIQKSKAKAEAKEKEEKVEAPKGKKFNPGKGKKSQGTLESFVTAETNYDTGDGKIDKDVIKISSWNINGLRAILGKNEIEKYVSKEKPDILCLNETKVDKEALDNEQIGKKMPKDYFQYWNCCKCSKGYSGVAVFSLTKPLSVKADLGIPEHDQEGRTLTLEFEKFYLVSCYVPNAGEKLVRLSYRTKKWDVAFRNYLNELKKKKHVILCGDLNVAHHEIDISNPKGNLKSAGFTVEERDEFTNLLNTGFVDSFRELYPKEVKYSYWSMRSNARATNKGWRLDYFVVDSDGFKKGVQDSIINNDVHGSDHCPIELTWKLKSL